MYEHTKTTTIDYHQKPIADMTPGELRAYRRELARAALTGLIADKLMPASEYTQASYYQADQMIEHERREEGGAE